MVGDKDAGDGESTGRSGSLPDEWIAGRRSLAPQRHRGPITATPAIHALTCNLHRPSIGRTARLMAVSPQVRDHVQQRVVLSER